MARPQELLACLEPADRSCVEEFLFEFDCQWTADSMDEVLSRVARFVDSLQVDDQQADAVRRAVAWEAAKIDLEHRLRNGQELLIDWYCERWPDWFSGANIPTDAIQAEWESRSRYAQIELDEFKVRFPEQIDQLNHLVRSQGKSIELPRKSHLVLQRALKVPEKLGRYRIREMVGSGGMGRVYRAFDCQLEREVALKVPQLDIQVPIVSELFRREATVAARLHHPNICPVFDAGQIDGIPYITMALIRGEPLSRKLARPYEFTLKSACGIVEQIASAVHVAHQHGVVHRDLKPSNVIIDVTGLPIVTDFGIAAISRLGERELEPENQVAGSDYYMAPEQVDPSSPVAATADVYSLGRILKKLIEKIELDSSGDGGVLREIVERATLDDPAKRYRTAEEFAAAIRTSKQIPGIRRSLVRRLGLLVGVGCIVLVYTVAVWMPTLRDSGKFNRQRSADRTPLAKESTRLVMSANSAVELMKILRTPSSQLPPGEVRRVELAAGDYVLECLEPLTDCSGNPQMKFVLTAADPKKPPVLTTTNTSPNLYFSDVANIELSNLIFDVTGEGLHFHDCTNVELRNVKFLDRGERERSYEDVALYLAYCSDFEFDGCAFSGSDYGSSIQLNACKRGRIYRCRISSATDDQDGYTDSMGINIRYATHQVDIADCTFIGCERAIQCGALGPSPDLDDSYLYKSALENYQATEQFETKDISIRNNLFIEPVGALAIIASRDLGFHSNTVFGASQPLRNLPYSEPKQTSAEVAGNLFVSKAGHLNIGPGARPFSMSTNAFCRATDESARSIGLEEFTDEESAGRQVLVISDSFFEWQHRGLARPPSEREGWIPSSVDLLSFGIQANQSTADSD